MQDYYYGRFIPLYFWIISHLLIEISYPNLHTLKKNTNKNNIKQTLNILNKHNLIIKHNVKMILRFDLI